MTYKNKFIKSKGIFVTKYSYINYVCKLQIPITTHKQFNTIKTLIVSFLHFYL